MRACLSGIRVCEGFPVLPGVGLDVRLDEVPRARRRLATLDEAEVRHDRREDGGGVVADRVAACQGPLQQPLADAVQARAPLVAVQAKDAVAGRPVQVAADAWMMQEHRLLNVRDEGGEFAGVGVLLAGKSGGGVLEFLLESLGLAAPQQEG